MRIVGGSVAIVLTSILGATPAGAQGPVAARLEARPTTLVLNAGDSAKVLVAAYDSSGAPIETPVRFFSSARRDLPVSRDGVVTGVRGGTYQVYAVAQDGGSARDTIDVTVRAAPVTQVVVTGAGERLFVGASVPHAAAVRDRIGELRGEVPVTWSTSDPRVATVDRLGRLTALREGTVAVRATAAGVTGERRYRVERDPIRTLTVSASAESVRLGDVVHLTTAARDQRGQPVGDLLVTYTLTGMPAERAAAQFPAAEVDQQGRFVAYEEGQFTVMAEVAGHVARTTIVVGPRHASRAIELVGQAAVRDVHTSDLWIWTGRDGRDYAITGTWGANGAAYFWDVTDPAVPALVDSVVVDARTVNDVKVSEDGAICVISREGASNRRNGIVILDCSNPRNVTQLSTFDDDLTGGVHNVFVYRNHVFAVNNGRKYDIISIEDPRHPQRVGVFELTTPGHAIHDVWVVDGIAYSSNWSDGTVMVDVGNGIAGGSPAHPVQIAEVKAVGGANHAAFPYKSPTGKTYLFMGDEIFPYGLSTGAGSIPTRAAGYIHIMDVTDPRKPEEVARYEVPEAGSHNFWIQGDTLYAAFYNGGMRVVDISGELKGNLYYQGREVAQYLSYDPQGFIANAPMVWGPQPHKGYIFFSDWNSGLWAVKLQSQVLTP